MQILAKLTKMFINEPGIMRRFTRASTRNTTAALVDDLRRELYGMDMHEQAVVMQLVARAGQDVTIRRDTVAFGKNGKPCYLGNGSKVNLSKNPLRIDPDAGVRVVMLDQGNNYISIKLSDYIKDIHVGH